MDKFNKDSITMDDAMNSDDWVDYNFDYYINIDNDFKQNADNVGSVKENVKILSEKKHTSPQASTGTCKRSKNKRKLKQNTDKVGSEYFDVNIQMLSEQKHSLPQASAGTCKHSKNKRKATPESGAFDKLLTEMNYNILHSYLKKLHEFLESNSSKEICLPYVSEQFEDIFKNIVQDIRVLRSKSLDNNYRDICDKIINTVHTNKSVFLLSYVYENRKEYINNRVLVIKKVFYTKEQATNRTSLSTSSESHLASSESSSEEEPDKLLKRSPPVSISLGFKMHCLRAVLAFVESNTTTKIEFPELVPKQADWMQKILQSVTSSSKFDYDLRLKDLLIALWEAVKIHGLKYDFKINSEYTFGGTKSLVFEKIVKEKPADITVDTNQIINQKPEVIIQGKPNINWSKLEKYGFKNIPRETLIHELPRAFVLKALNSTIKFLTDENAARVSFAPKSMVEASFYRCIINWGQMAYVPSCDPEFKCLLEKVAELLRPMKVKVPSSKKNNTNLKTGLKEVTFIKKPKRSLPTEVPNTAQRLRKNKKIKLQDVLNSDKAAETPITDLLNKSLRNKKKNKKRSRNNLETSKESLNEINVSKNKAFKPVEPKPRVADNVRHGNDRAVSLDRKKAAPAPEVPKRTTEEVIASIRSSIATREKGYPRPRGADETQLLRKERLSEAFPVTVHTEKVTKSTEEVIDSIRTSIAAREKGCNYRENQLRRKERLLEALSVPVQSEKAMKMMRGMGWSGGALGVRGNGITEPIMPSLELLSGAGFGHTRKDTKKSKNPTKTWDPKRKVPKLKTTTVMGPNWLTEDPADPTQAQSLENDVIVQKTRQLLKENISFDSLINDQRKTSTLEVPKLKYFRKILLSCILKFVCNDDTVRLLICKAPLSSKHKTFIKQTIKAINGNDKLSISKEDNEVLRQIMENLKPGVELQASVSTDRKEVELKKLKISSDDESNQLSEKEKESPYPLEFISIDDDMMAFINALHDTCQSKRAFNALKFRVLILLNILNFVRSDDEELEVMFNTVVPMNQRRYIQSTMEAVNSRLKFGRTPAESGLSFEIKNYIGDSVIGMMFNHHYTSFTLIKYYSMKTSNKSADVAKPKRKTVDRDNIISDSSNDTVIISEDITNKDNNNILTENNNNEIEKNKNGENKGADLISKSDDNENAEINQVAALNKHAKSHVIVKEITDIRNKGHFDMYIGSVDCNNEVKINKEIVIKSIDSSEVIAESDIDKNENLDEIITETIDLTGNDVDKMNSENDEAKTLLLENDDSNISNPENNTLESRENNNCSTDTLTSNKDEIISLSDDDDDNIEERSNSENIDTPMKDIDTSKQIKFNEDDIINIIEDDTQEEPDTKICTGIDKEIEINCNDNSVNNMAEDDNVSQEEPDTENTIGIDKQMEINCSENDVINITEDDTQEEPDTKNDTGIDKEMEINCNKNDVINMTEDNDTQEEPHTENTIDIDKHIEINDTANDVIIMTEDGDTQEEPDTENTTDIDKQMEITCTENESINITEDNGIKEEQDTENDTGTNKQMEIDCTANDVNIMTKDGDTQEEPDTENTTDIDKQMEINYTENDVIHMAEDSGTQELDTENIIGIDKQIEINCTGNDVINITEDDDTQEKPDTKNDTGIDKQMEINYTANDVINMTEDDNVIEEEQNTENIINEETEIENEGMNVELITEADDLIKIIDKVPSVTYSEANQIYIQYDSLKEIIKNHEAMKIINKESAVDLNVAAAPVAGASKKTYCDKVTNQIIDLSKDNTYDQEHFDNNVSESNKEIGKINSNIKFICILPANPNDIMTDAQVNKIKKIFSDNILMSKEFPLLKVVALTMPP